MLLYAIAPILIRLEQVRASLCIELIGHEVSVYFIRFENTNQLYIVFVDVA